MKILFVCTGNTCRSPMAEAICRDEMTRRGIPGEAASAGLSPLPGDMTNPLTLRVLADHGVPAEAKPAVPLTPELLAASDVVAVMTRQHADLLARVLPPVRPKLRVLDVCDPYGGGPDEYEQCYRQLRAAVDRLLAGAEASGEAAGNENVQERAVPGETGGSAAESAVPAEAADGVPRPGEGTPHA